MKKPVAGWTEYKIGYIIYKWEYSVNGVVMGSVVPYDMKTDEYFADVLLPQNFPSSQQMREMGPYPLVMDAQIDVMKCVAAWFRKFNIGLPVHPDKAEILQCR